MHKLFVADLTIGSQVSTPLAVYEKRLKSFTDRMGQPAQALMMTLGDRTGRMAAVAWQNALEYHAQIAVDRVYLFTGRMGEYRGQPQLVVDNVAPLGRSQIAIGDFLPEAPQAREYLWNRMEAVMQSIEQPHLQMLLQQIFDESRRDAFCIAPGGREVHHAYAGGLLEHTLEVVAYGKVMLREQGHNLERDLLLTGCILHDIGKIEEYDLQSISFQTTDKGKLLGHLQIGAQMIDDVAARIPDFPPELLLELKHMILSHHGVPEWGSPQEPRTINAMALHLADLTSGRLAQFSRIIANHSPEDGPWSSWDRFLQRSIYVSLKE